MANHSDKSSSDVSGGIVPILVQRIGQTTRVTFPSTMANATEYSDLFRRVFRVRRVVAEKCSSNVKLGRISQPLFVERDGLEGLRMTFPSALEPLLVQLCEVLGLPVMLTGLRPAALSLAMTASLVDLQMLHAVANHEHLVVRHEHHAVDVAPMVGQVCLAFPTLKVIVLVKLVSEARRVANRLHALGVDVALFTSATKTKQKPSRVAVATFQSAGHEDVRIWGRELVLVHDVADAMSKAGRVPLRFVHIDNPSAPRVIGFAKADFTPSINQNVELLTVYGPIEIMVPRHGAVVRQVEYAMLPVAGMNYTKVNAAQSSSTGEAKHVFVWSNPVRNRLVAKIARGFAEGHVESVVGRVPELVGHPLLGKPVGVLVVVENGLHGRNLLHHQLRGWSAIGPDIGIVPPSAPRWGWPADKPTPAVCTFDGLKALNVASFDVVIRADAGTGGLPLSKHALVSGITDVPLMLLDFDDYRDPLLASHADQRRAAYDAAGWLPVDGSREHRELHRFLARHPQGKKVRRQMEKLARLIAAPNCAG